MANNNAPFGLKPLNLNGTTWSGQGKLIHIPTSQNANIFIGDPLIPLGTHRRLRRAGMGHRGCGHRAHHRRLFPWSRQWSSRIGRDLAAKRPDLFRRRRIGLRLRLRRCRRDLLDPGRLLGRRHRHRQRRLFDGEPSGRRRRLDRHRHVELAVAKLQRRRRATAPIRSAFSA